ncbi:Fukutin [Halotydeus destructor]|nr:Fukutin [Halotydeus destructor]
MSITTCLYLLYGSNYGNSSRFSSLRTGYQSKGEHFDFLRNEFAIKFNLFIIEPSILIKLISPEDLVSLVQHKLLPTSATNYNSSVLSLGHVHSRQSPDLCRLLPDFQLDYWQCSSGLVKTPFYGNDFKQLSTLGGDVIGHYVLTNIELIIHIVVFHEKDNYLWVDELSGDLVKDYLVFGLGGRHLYDHFTIEQAQLTLDHGRSLEVSVPSEAWYFLSQLETSRYASCNYKMAAKWKGGRASEAFLKKGLQGVVAMKKLTKHMRINFWLDSGTLLGWYRECDVIPYTDDYDFATWARYVQFQEGPTFRSHIQDTLKSSGSDLKLFCTYGFPSEAYEMAFKQDGVKLDFFFAYETEHSHQIGGHVVQNGSYFYYVYPKFTLCSAILLGHKVLVPCDSELTLKTVYGDHWSEPVKSFHWATAPFNMGPLKKWPPGTVGSYWVNKDLH